MEVLTSGAARRSRRHVAAVAVAVPAGALDLLIWGGENGWRWGGQAPGWLVPAAVSVSVAALVVRSRWPRAVFGLQWTWALAGLAIPLFAPFAGLVVAVQTVAARLPARTAFAAALACAVPFGVDAVNAGASVPDRYVSTAVVAALTWCVLVVAAVAVGRARYNADRRAELSTEIARRNAEDARRAERLRLARELHDVVAHALSGIVLQAAGARVAALDVDATLRSIETSGVRAMDELGRMLGLMRTEPPGVQDVRGLVDDSVAAGMGVTLHVEGAAVTLGEEAELTVYRIVQEGLTNARKHGGPGCEVEVRFRWSAGELALLIRSRSLTGPTTLPGAGQGLVGLGERVRSVGGEFEAGPDADDFVLRAAIPVPFPDLVDAA